MELRIPLSVTNLAFLAVGVCIGFSCTANANNEQIDQYFTRMRQLEKSGKAPVHIPLYGNSDPCLANIEKLCAEIDRISLSNPNMTLAERGLQMEQHEQIFGSAPVKHE